MLPASLPAPEQPSSDDHLTAWKPYPAYKGSGVEWLGQIPMHWEVRLLKRLFLIVNGATARSSEPSFWEGAIPWITPEDLGNLNSEAITLASRTITEELLEELPAVRGEVARELYGEQFMEELERRRIALRREAGQPRP